MSLTLIPGFLGHYAASIEGEIWSLKKHTPRKMKTFPRCGNGYLGVTLSIEGAFRVYSVSRLVAMAFLGKPKNPKMVVMHKDDNRTNNNPLNLRWGTHADNSMDMINKSRQAVGEKCGNARLTAEKVKAIRIMAQSKSSYRIAKDMNMSATNIRDIINKRTWSHI